MKEEAITDALLRQFLLGKVDDEERQRIESLFLTDSTMRDRVFAVEQELVEDYLEDSLSPGDREAFLLHYAQTPEQQRKLRITKSIKDWAVEESATHDVLSTTPVWNRQREKFRPAFVLPVAAVVILAIVLAVVWFNRRQEQRRHSAVEQELAQLNDPSSLRDVPLVGNSLRLSPGTLRGPVAQAELPLRSDVPFVELHLLWSRSERYPRYRAVVQRFDGDEAYTIANLRPESDGQTIRLRLSTHMLRKGLYQVHLSGITPDGSAGVTNEYQFTVVQ